jgi:hypothetical protein
MPCKKVAHWRFTQIYPGGLRRDLGEQFHRRSDSFERADLYFERIPVVRGASFSEPTAEKSHHKLQRPSDDSGFMNLTILSYQPRLRSCERDIFIVMTISTLESM